MSFILSPDGRPYLVDTGPQPGWDNQAEMSVDAMEDLLRNLVMQNRGSQRTSPIQGLLDEATEACLSEGEIELGLSIAVLNMARVAGQQHLMCECLVQLTLDLKQRSKLLG